MSVRLQIWPKDGGHFNTTAHPTAEDAMRHWRSTVGKSISVLGLDEDQTRRPTHWEAAQAPARLLASSAFVARFSHRIETRELPENLDSDYLAVIVGHAGRPPVPEQPSPAAPPPKARSTPNFPRPLILAAYPEAFLGRSLDDLGLKPEMRSKLGTLPVATVADLVPLMDHEYPGRPSDLRTGVDRAFRKARRLQMRASEIKVRSRLRRQRMEQFGDQPLLLLVSESMQPLNPHQREMLSRTLGLDGPPESMAAIGRSMGVTRERVRQVVNRSIDLCDVSHGWATVFAREMSRVCLLGPASVAFADAPWAAGMGTDTVDVMFKVIMRWQAQRVLANATRR